MPRKKSVQKIDPEQVSQWVDQIDAALSKNTLTFLAVGDLLNKAKAEVNDKTFTAVIKKSGLRSKKTAENYMRVASKTILREPEVMKHLPQSIGTLIDLAAWTDEEIKSGIANGKIRADAKRKELKKDNGAKKKAKYEAKISFTGLEEARVVFTDVEIFYRLQRLEGIKIEAVGVLVEALKRPTPARPLGERLAA